MLSVDLIFWGSCRDQVRACIHGAVQRLALNKCSGTASHEDEDEKEEEKKEDTDFCSQETCDLVRTTKAGLDTGDHTC